MYREGLTNKFKEAVDAVFPIFAIMVILCNTLAPIPSGILLGFLVGIVFVVFGMMFFTLGAELAMHPMGNDMGSGVTRTKNLPLILFVGFMLGVLITMSEPDLQVLANQVKAIPNTVLILAVAIGVGIFLVISLLRILFGWSLRTLFIIFYIVVFVLIFFAPKSFWAVAFDSGGVTTGPMTVPFIMAFGLGISAIRNDKKAAEDSFGLVALCSIGPILAVTILSMIYRPETADYSDSFVANVEHTVELRNLFLEGFPEYIKEIAISILPIVVFFGVFQIFLLKLSKTEIIRISVGLLYTYIGLVLFLTGANVGFMPAGSYLGTVLASQDTKWIIIPIGAVIGYFIVQAEPAVYVLMQQVEEITDGAIMGKTLRTCLSIGISISVSISMIRVLYGINIMWFLIPGYAISLILSFVVPEVFTAIAFDSGGVASGPMTATFLLPFAIGACVATGGDVVSDAFGVVAMVAMTPLFTIQILGLVTKLKEKYNISFIDESKIAHGSHYEIIEL